MLEHQAITDNILKDHLISAKRNAKYTSKTIQEEIISVLGEVMKENLTEPFRTGNTKFFSVIADEVHDKLDNKEVLSVCIRYVDTRNKAALINEVLLDFRHLERTTGEALGKVIVDVLRSNNLDLSYLRGHAYDGSSAMSSPRVGAQAYVKAETYTHAHYIHCHSHVLNLAIASSSKLQDIRNIIGLINEVFLFFDYSPKRQLFFY